tara:strand:+ start:8035 stop:8373 length:339 start_codon:yes stop_codon:yes gene_type:complete
MSFSAIPGVPQAGLNEWQFQFMNSTKQNLEQLTGQSGSSTYKAVLSGQIGIIAVPEQAIRQVTIGGGGYTISGANVAANEDLISLATNVQALIGDVAVLHDAVNTLIAQLRG